MTIIFKDYGRPSGKRVVQEVLKEIQINLMVFKIIARIFNTFKTNDPSSLDMIDKVIEKSFNSPKFKIKPPKKKELVRLLKSIYRESNFSEIRSDVLELMVYRFGPFSERNREVIPYIEPRIMHNNTLIGGNGRKIDNVFYINDHEPIEFVECKANIENVIPSNFPLNDMQRRDHREKIEYLVHAHSYLSKNFVEPHIYLACYNDNYEKQMTNVHDNWGFRFIKFL